MIDETQHAFSYWELTVVPSRPRLLNKKIQLQSKVMLWIVLPVVAAILPQFNLMATMPVIRDSFEPRTLVKSAYQYITSSNNVVAANFKWDARRPTLILDNFKQINEIECSGNSVTITFDTVDSASMAFRAWSQVHDLAIVLGHEHECQGIKNVSTLSVNKISSPEENRLVLDTTGMSYSELMGGYELEITKRTPEQHQFFRTRKSTFKSKEYKIDYNYDRYTQKVKEPVLLIPNVSVGIGRDYVSTYGKCTNCFMTGTAHLELYIKSKMGVIKQYKLVIDGEVKANMDMNIDIRATHKSKLINNPIAEVPLTPIYVPGVLQFGPMILFKTSVELRVEQRFQFTFGYNYTYKFGVTVESDPLNPGTPKTTQVGKPIVDAHMYKSATDSQITISAHVAPAFEIGLHIFQNAVFELTMKFDNSIGVRVSGGIASGCAHGRRNIAMVEKHTLGVGVNLPGDFRMGTALLTTGNMVLACAFCDRCF